MIDVLQTWGLWGLFVGSFLAATVVPFSADAMMGAMLLAGLSPIGCFVAASIGNWFGGLTSFGLGWLGKTEWLERFYHVKPSTIERQKQKVAKWGEALALMSWLPIVGDVFAIALGFYKLRPVRCAVFMFIGKTLRFAIWLGVFYLIGEEVVLL